MRTLLVLELLRVCRDARFLIFTIAMPTIVYTTSAQESYGSIGDVPVAKYMLISLGTFGAIGAALTAAAPRISQERQVGWTRQLRLSPMPGRTYVTVKMLTASLVSLVSILLIFAYGAVLKHVEMPAAQWIEAVLTVWLGSLVFGALSVMLGYMFSPSSITVGLLVCTFGFSMLGGLFWPVSSFPGWLQPVARATPTYHLAAVGHAVQVGHLPQLTNVAVLVVCMVVFSGVAAWLYRRDEAGV